MKLGYKGETKIGKEYPSFPTLQVAYQWVMGNDVNGKWRPAISPKFHTAGADAKALGEIYKRMNEKFVYMKK